MATSRSPGSLLVTSAPSISTRPPLTDSSPAMMRSAVVLPEPDGPSSTKNSPGSMARSMPCSTVVVPCRFTTPSRRTLPEPLIAGLRP